MYRPIKSSQRAFDAAGSSGLAFLESQLELIKPKLIEPLEAITHPRDVPVEVGGGFPEFVSAFAANYGSPATGLYGMQGTANTEISTVSADIQKGVFRTVDWACAMVVRYLDLQRMETAARLGIPPPISLQQLYEKGIRLTWNKALDYVAYKGFPTALTALGTYGLINNANAPEFTVSGGTWLSKLSTPTSILTDVNTAIETIMSNSAYDIERGMPNHMLVPWTQWGYLTNPMTLGGVGNGFNSIKDYIEKSCVAAASGTKFVIDPLPNPWISGAGSGSPATDRAVVYRNDDDCLQLPIPQVMTKGFTVPTDKNGGSWVTIYYGNIGQIVWKRNQTIIYMDGV